MTERCILILIILAVAFAPGCSDNPSSTEPETLSYFEISAPPAAGGGDQFELTVEAVGSRGTKPFGDFSGTVLLTVSDGEITPVSVALSGGQGEETASVTGTAGSCEITASAVGKTGFAYLTILLDSIPGDPGALVADAIPDIRYRADYRDFSNDHPSLGGMFLSFNSLAVAFIPGTTVGEANAVLDLIDADIAGGIPGSAGSYEGLLALRLSASTHAEMESSLSTLRGHAKVARAVQDILMALDFTPKANGENPADWKWNTPPAGANWNLERIRAPQMWNLNEAVRKRNNTIATLVIDRGFAAAHPDLDFTALNALTVAEDHGAHVAGIIGAKVDNGAGIDGVNPFASLRLYEYVRPGEPAGAGLPAEYDWRLSVHDAVIWTLRNLIVTHAGLRVINMSLGYNWSLAGINSQTSAEAQLLADTQGRILADMIQQLSVSDMFPLIVVSAGNDSYGGAGINEQYALYNSPMCNAALSHGTKEIVVVEAVENAPGVGDGEATRCFFSNIGGHVSAPGQDIWSLTVSAPFYKQNSGTSMASPHVAGLAGFLLAIDPDLSYEDIKELIISNAKNIPVGAARIDAWASAVDIDRLRGGDDVLRMLCDVDDGTEDGNLRIVLRDNTAFTGSDNDADGGRGDGTVDMSDFRRWRDWLNQAAGTADLALDGGAAHIKRDLNGDGRVENAALENVYPIGDFNGDGKLSLADASRVPGAINAEATDLEVLQAVFNDPNYTAADLDNLVASADITVDLTALFRIMEENQAVVEIRRAADG